MIDCYFYIKQNNYDDTRREENYAENMATVKGSNTQCFGMSNFAKDVYTLSLRNEQYSITKQLVLQ